MTQKSIVFLFLLIVSQQVFSQKTQYNIKDFGAMGDGVTICTAAINSAIEKCSLNGGGTVVVPVGIFLSGSILMKKNVELYLEIGSTLLASTDKNDFPKGALIYAQDLSNIAITGFGTIDGNGELQRTMIGKAGTGFRQQSIRMVSCRQIRIEGIRLINTGTWVQHYFNCEDLFIDRIEVYTHSNHNNDATDIDGCRRVVISNSIFDSDDDAITLKSTSTAPTEDVVITNCVISSCYNAIKAGTESIGGFRNISISNCVVKPSWNKSLAVYSILRDAQTAIALEIVDGGVMEGVSINNITVEGTRCPLYIRLGNRGRKPSATDPDPPVGKLRNVGISNIIAYNTANFCSSITGIPGYYIENVTIDNIQIYNQGGLKTGEYKASHNDVEEDEKGYPHPITWGNLPSSVFFIRHVKGISINNLTFGSNQSDPRIPVIAVDVERFRLGKSIFSGPSISPYYVLLDDVKEFDIEKPLGWGQNPVIKQ